MLNAFGLFFDDFRHFGIYDALGREPRPCEPVVLSISRNAGAKEK